MRVIELRNYLLAPGKTSAFIRYFEEHFLQSQRDQGMYPIGQFELAGEPDRFVWIRVFENMRTRLRGLTGFYGGPFWQARRDEANAMILEHHDVHLLRPLVPVSALTDGRSPADAASAPAGPVADDTGLVVRTSTASLPRRWRARSSSSNGRCGRRSSSKGIRFSAISWRSSAPNDYPRLPVTQDPGLLVVMSAYRDPEHCRTARRDWDARGPISEPSLRSRLTADVATLHLRPTARSLIRYRETPRHR